MAHAEVERDGGVMTVTLNRPQRYNAMTLTMFAQLADVWQEASENVDIRCVILTGAGGNFCSGMDLRAMAGDSDEEGAIDTAARMNEDPGFIYRGILKTFRPTKPVIAAVEGVAIAGGTEILQGTDIRVAGERRGSASRKRAGRCTRWAARQYGSDGRSRTRRRPRSCSPAGTSPRPRPRSSG